MGRKRLGKAEKRAEIIQFRMTAEERKICEAAAKRDGVKMFSAWIRDQLLKAAGQSR